MAAGAIEGTKERIHYYRDWIRLLWAATLLNGSGLVGLALSLDNTAKRIAFLMGILLEGVFGVLIFVTHGKIRTLIAKLEAMP